MGTTLSLFPTWLPSRVHGWSERSDGYELAIDLPDFRRRDVALEIREDVLDVFAERERGFWSKERRAAHHVITLPASADSGAVRADFRSGRLVVEVSKRPEAVARTIPIRVNGELPPHTASLDRRRRPALRWVDRIRDAWRSAVEALAAAFGSPQRG